MTRAPVIPDDACPALNATAVRDTHCHQCKGAIANGARCRVFRERALSYAHARAAGTMYPKVRICARCAGVKP